jgi:hypothetical protein
MNTEKIKFQFVDESAYTGFPCNVCEGSTDNDIVLCEVVTDGQNDDLQWRFAGTRICESCLKHGDVDSILKTTAETQERTAKLKRELIGNVALPTAEEYGAYRDHKGQEAQKKLDKKIAKTQSKLERAQRKLEMLQVKVITLTDQQARNALVVGSATDFDFDSDTPF